MKNLKEQKYWIWLSRIRNVGNIKKLQLLEKYKTPYKIYLLNKNVLVKEGLKNSEIDDILNENYRQKLDKYINYMKENKIEIINYVDYEYPQNLKLIYDYPISIYIKGNKNILNYYSIAIVGCRDCTMYGQEVAKQFAYNLSKENVVIISGLARGIDSFSHIGTICGKGNTIAVLGNGLDTIYPSENRILADRILQNDGAIISEYPLGTKPEKMNFPARNRIISGLSNGVIVVEAKKESGTMITVDFALEQGKEIFVVPGNINSKNSEGTNNLIKEGAQIITNYKEILENV